ncbi:MAG: response regulator [Spirochaetales bacterium]|nr:response regulator [Spirochaetales bacterium]
MDKVLIVDDEQPVLEGLQYLISRQFPDIECLTASTGREAIEIVRLQHPDIVLMDVKMPGMSGIDAIRELKSLSPQTLFILVTAYERFEIAKEAISLGVQEYLLKPVSKDALLEVLNRVYLVLQERRAQQRREISYRDWRQEAARYLEQTLLFQLAYSCTSKDAEALLRLLGLETAAGCVVWMEWRSLEGKDLEKDFEVWQENLKFKQKCALGSWIENRFAVFLPLNDEEAPWQKFPPPPAWVQWRAAVGKPQGLDRLSLSYQQALLNLENVPWGKWGLAENENISNESGKFPFILEKALLRALQVGDADRVGALVVPFWTALEASATPERPLGVLAREMVTVVTHQKGVEEDVYVPEAEVLAVSKALEDLGSEQAREVFKKFFLRWTRRHQPAPGFSPVVDRAMRFLRENFQKAISLEDAAQAVGVHAQYLSRLFTQERGESFVDVLTRLRMSKARELLREGASVKETAASLGYADANYFSRLFKKWEGVPPGDFADGKRGSS